MNAKGLIRQLIVNLQQKGAITIITKDQSFRDFPGGPENKTSPSSAGGVRSAIPGHMPQGQKPKHDTEAIL